VIDHELLTSWRAAAARRARCQHIFDLGRPSGSPSHRSRKLVFQPGQTNAPPRSGSGVRRRARQRRPRAGRSSLPGAELAKRRPSGRRLFFSSDLSARVDQLASICARYSRARSPRDALRAKARGWTRSTAAAASTSLSPWRGRRRVDQFSSSRTLPGNSTRKAALRSPRAEDRRLCSAANREEVMARAARLPRSRGGNADLHHVER